jgi:nucleoid-associated protein YgaU
MMKRVIFPEEAPGVLPAAPVAKSPVAKSPVAVAVLCVFLLSLLFCLSRPGNASPGEGEDTVRISLHKKILRGKISETYTVRRGEWILQIIRDVYGVPRGEEMEILKAIRSMNPGISNFNKIYPGQEIYLPAGAEKSPQAKQSAAAPETAGSKEEKTGKEKTGKEETVSWKIRRGETVSGVLVRRFGVSGRDLEAGLVEVKRLNPRISDLDRIYPGQILRFPAGWARQREEGPSPAEKREPLQAVPERSLPALRDILQRAGGKVETEGVYYIPVVPSGTIHLPCGRFPVVEFPNGKKVVLNLPGNMEEPLKELLRTSWEGCSVFDPPVDGGFGKILKGILQLSGSHEVTQTEEPVEAKGNPKIRVRIHQRIAWKADGTGGGRFGIRYVRNRDELLTENLKNVLRERGLDIVEILEAGDGAEIVSGALFGGREPERLEGVDSMDLARSFLVRLGFSVSPDREMSFFQSGGNAVGLSVRADLYAKKGETVLALFSEDPHPDLKKAMSGSGILAGILPGGKNRKATLEKLLSLLNLPARSENLTFPLPGDGGEEIILSVIRFDLDGEAVSLVEGDPGQDMTGYLAEKHGLKVVLF